MATGTWALENNSLRVSLEIEKLTEQAQLFLDRTENEQSLKELWNKFRIFHDALTDPTQENIDAFKNLSIEDKLFFRDFKIFEVRFPHNQIVHLNWADVKGYLNPSDGMANIIETRFKNLEG